MAIPLVDLTWQHQQIRSTLDATFERVLSDPICDDMIYAHELEALFADYFDAPDVHAITTQSGTSAQFLALKGLGLGPGDEVITVANSDLPTTASISHTGASFRLIDVDARTHNMDVDQIEAAIGPHTRAIVPVHLFGLPATMDQICAIADRHGLFVIEDATLALGAIHHGVQVGLWGDAAFFSFAPRKVMGGLSNGGMIVTRDAAIAHKIRTLRGYGQDPSRGELPITERHLHAGMVNLVEGYNLKMDGVQAAVVAAKVPYLDEWGAMRQAVADRYQQNLTDLPGVIAPVQPADGRHAWRNYVIQTPPERRDAVRAHLTAKDITTATLYAPPVHLQPVYAHLKLGAGTFPVAEALAQSLIALPIFPGMSTEQVDEVTASLAEALDE